MKIKRMALLAVYTTIALTIFVVEAMLPTLTPLPGIKLGLANIVTLWLLLVATPGDAFLVLLMRIILASIAAGQMMSFAYSLAGGLFCFSVMALLFRLTGKKYVIFISIFGALFHNLGQICAAIAVLQSLSILAYLPVLTVSAVVTGCFTGLCTHFVSQKFPKDQAWPL